MHRLGVWRSVLPLLLACALVQAACNGPRRVMSAEDPFAYPLLRPQEWIEIRDGSLAIYSNAPVREVHDLVEELSRLRGALARVTNFLDPDEPPAARVILFRSHYAYRYFQPSQTTGAYFVHVPQGQTIVSHAGLEEVLRVAGKRYRGDSPFGRSTVLQMLYH